MTRIAPIELDFVRPGGPSARSAPLLLVLGVACAAGVLAYQRVLMRQEAARADEIERMRDMSRRSGQTLAGRESDSPEVREQIKRANAVLAQMNVPWGELFAAIEMAQDDSIGLLAVQPDPRARQLTIGGQARTLTALLAYMERLQRTERLHEVALTSHELLPKEPGQPVEFTLTARWVELR